MTTFQDCMFGLKKESAFGTKVTVDRFPQPTDFSVNAGKGVKQSEALRVGRRVNAANRRVVTTWNPSGSLETELASVGQGALWEWLMGAGTSTLVSSGVYQQVFTLADSMPTASLQAVVPSRVGSTVADVTSAVCTGFELSFEAAEILTVKAEWVGRKVATGGVSATPSYTNGNLYHFAGASIYSGTFTAPTTTALGIGSTPLLNVQGGSLSVSHEMATDGDGFTMGGMGYRTAAPTPGTREISGSLKVEAGDATLIDAMLTDAAFTVVLTWEAGSLAAGKETLQVCLPAVFLDAADLPKPNGGDMPTLDLPFTVLHKEGVAQPIWAVLRTSDAAL